MGGDYYDYDNTDNGQIRRGNPNSSSPQQHYYQQQQHSQHGNEQAPPEYIYKLIVNNIKIIKNQPPPKWVHRTTFLARVTNKCL